MQIGKAQIIFDSQFRCYQPAKAGIRSSLTPWSNTSSTSPRQESHTHSLDVAIIATGPLLHKAILAAKQLDAKGKRVAVMDLSTIKPLDETAIIKLAHDSGAIVTVEDHQIAGGMGSAVAECLAAHFPVPIEFVGVKDRFGQSGKPDELIELYGMGEKSIIEAIHRVMVRK